MTRYENKGKDRPARTSHVAFVVASQYHLQIIFLLSQACLKETFAFCKRWSEVLENLFSARADCIRLHCSINICFKFLIARWYIVTKGNKRSWPFSFCVCLRADYQETKLTLTETFLWCFLGTLLLWGVVWISNGPPQNVFFRRVSSRKSYCLQPYFMPGGWHEAKCVNWRVSVGL